MPVLSTNEFIQIQISLAYTKQQLQRHFLRKNSSMLPSFSLNNVRCDKQDGRIIPQWGEGTYLPARTAPEG